MTVLVTGAAGQIGSELTAALRERYDETVVTSDIARALDALEEPCEVVDVTDREALETVVEDHDVDTMYHLAAILSAAGEQNPQAAYQVNVNGLYNALEVSRDHGVEKLIVPSSIAVFGPTTPNNPGESTVLEPNTMYGISKVMGELFGDYYYDKYGLDVRGLRYPGILSYKTKPGGGTTDYAVEVFYEAIEHGEYTYFVREDTKLPMMYMPDAVKAMIDLAEADGDGLRYRSKYNVGALSFTPKELTAEIRKHIPSFEASYEPDDRQEIADSWPDDVDDSAARADWGWEPDYDFEALVEDMLTNLRYKLDATPPQ
jgi:nucleoside-diphosphate-sugar epimerase